MKWIGAENEYGIFLHNDDYAFVATDDPFLVIQEACLRLASQNTDSPFIWTREYGNLNAYSGEFLPSFDCWLKNGARFYRDQKHVEYSTPECETVREAVLAEKAGEKLFSLLLKENDREKFFILKRICSSEFISKGQNNVKAAGSHENYTINGELFRELISNESALCQVPSTARLNQCQSILVSHLVTRIIYTGSGHLERSFRENDKRCLRFWLSPRAFFTWCRINEHTTKSRAIINTKNDSLMSNYGMARLHLICGDANRSPWSLFLKYGITKLVLAFLESANSDRQLALAEKIDIRDPVGFLNRLSLLQPHSFSDRSPFRRALEIQRIL